MFGRAIKVAAIALFCCTAVVLWIHPGGGPITHGWQLCVSAPARAVHVGQPLILDVRVRHHGYWQMVYGSQTERWYGLLATLKDPRSGTSQRWRVRQLSREPLNILRFWHPLTESERPLRDCYCVSNVIDTSRTGNYVLQLSTRVDVDTSYSHNRVIELHSNPVTVTVTDDGLNTVRRDLCQPEGACDRADSEVGHINVTSESEAFWDHETPEQFELTVGWTNRTPVTRKLKVARDPLDDLDMKVLGVSPYLLGTAPGRTDGWGSPKRETFAQMKADDQLGRPTFRRFDNDLIGAPARDPVGAPVDVLLAPGETLRYRVPLSRLFDLTAVGTYLVSVKPRWSDQLSGSVTASASAFRALETHVVVRHGRPWGAAFGPWHGEP